MKKVKAPPGAKRLIESLRNMGYECSTAIADLIDNSLAAGASEVHVEMFAQSGGQPAGVVIADNGRGMDRDALYEAMRFGAFQEYSTEDLGKYGLGLKTASLSQCRNLTVSSKAKATRGTRPRRYFMRWDLDHVYRADDWDLLAPSSDELQLWEVEALTHAVAGENGTVVLWQGLDEALPLLTAQNVRQREKFLAYLIGEVGDHLRMVFHRFMEGSVTGRRRLNLYMCGQFTRDLDQSFAMNVTKMRARVPTEIRDQVRNALSKWAKDARARYDRGPVKRVRVASGAPNSPPAQAQASQSKRPVDAAPPSVTVGPVSFARSNAPTHKLSVVDGAKPGHLKILVPQSHELAAVFDTKGDDLLKLCVSAIGVLEAVYEQRMSRDRIPLESLKRALRKHL